MAAPYLDRTPRPNTGKRRIVIIGGGFGGLDQAGILSSDKLMLGLPL
jgi:cation diffusion facilitator CzcD-associated flavoprotein CzcO